MYYFYEGRTLRGVGLIGWSLIGFLFASIATGLTLALVGFLYGALIQNPSVLVGPLIGAFVGICSALVAELIAGITFLLGFIEIRGGRHEYGLEQSRSVERSLIFFIVFMALSTFAAGFSPSFGLVFGMTSPASFSTLPVSIVLSPVGALFAGFALTHAIHTVSSPETRSRMRMALILGVVGGAVGPALAYVATTARPVTLDQISLGIVASAVAGQGIAALSVFLFWLAYQETRRSLEAGTPAPVLPRMEQVYPWLYRPWTPYPYAPPGPPPPQPPKS